MELDGMTLDDFAKGMKKVIDSQAEVRHEHLRDIVMFSMEEPLPCGSQFFVQLNNFTLGFDRDTLIKFREEVNTGVAASLARRAVSPTDAPNPTCITCGGEVTADSGFSTTIGHMHFDCQKEERHADANAD